jgi:putative transposase
MMRSLGDIPFRLDIPPEQQVWYDGRVWTYRGRAADRERRLLFDDPDGIVRDLSDREVLDLQAERALRLMGAAEAAAFAREARGRKPWTVFDACDEDERGRVARIRKYIRAWELAGRPSRTPEELAPIIAATAEAEGDRAPPSVRTLQRHLAKWVENGRDPESLVRQSANRGNFSRRLTAEQDSLLQESVDRHYLKQPRPTLAVVFSLVRKDFERRNEGLPVGERVPMVGRSAVYRAMTLIDRYTATYCHRGRGEADRKFTLVEDGPATSRHNECWEIDHTTVDVIVIDPVTDLPIGRPIFTILIDRHTRMIMGHHVGWDAPGIQPTVECLRKAISLKDDLLAKVAGLRNPWPAFGIPDETVPDNAKHFKSKDFREVCEQLGIDVGRAPVLKAWFKGRVERVFRTFATGLFHLVPGTTFSNVFERLRENAPEKVAVCTLAELEALLIRFIVDIYNPRRHRILNTSPLLAWAHSVRLHGIRPPPNPADLASRLALPEWRTVQREGIQYEGLWYTGPELVDILISKRVDRVVKIKVDPNDLTRIHFIHPATNTPVELGIKHSMRGHVQGITRDTHMLARALQRNNPDLLEGEEGIVQAYGIILRVLEEKARGDGIANRAAAARHLEKLRERAERYRTESVGEHAGDGGDDAGDISAELFGILDGAANGDAGAQPPGQGAAAAEPPTGTGAQGGEAAPIAARQAAPAAAAPTEAPDAGTADDGPGRPARRRAAKQPQPIPGPTGTTGAPSPEAAKSVGRADDDDGIDFDALVENRVSIRGKRRP